MSNSSESHQECLSSTCGIDHWHITCDYCCSPIVVEAILTFDSAAELRRGNYWVSLYPFSLWDDNKEDWISFCKRSCKMRYERSQEDTTVTPDSDEWLVSFEKKIKI